MNESPDSRKLKAFVMLAKTASYTETARQFYLTHSVISHSIRGLEEQLDCFLFYKMEKR